MVLVLLGGEREREKERKKCSSLEDMLKLKTALSENLVAESRLVRLK